MVIICELAEQLKTVDKMGRCQSSTGIISILLKMWKVTLKFKYIELSSLFLKFKKLLMGSFIEFGKLLWLEIFKETYKNNFVI